MITRRLLLLLMLWPLLLWSQVNLVRWSNADFSATMLDNHISASNISASNVSINNIDQDNNNPGSIFYSFGGWNGSWVSSAIDVSKYVQFEVSPDSNYKIEMGYFDFRIKTEWGGNNQKVQIRYSKASNFSSYYTLLSETKINGNFTDYHVAFPAGTYVYGTEKLYIRVYAYNDHSPIAFEHNNKGTLGPTITGKVSLITPVVPKPNDDQVGTIKNTTLTVNILSNDDYQYTSPITKINLESQAENGTVVVNGSNNVTYTPNPNFVGYDEFYYSLTNAVGTSESAKVQVQVIDDSGTYTEKVLVRWRSDDDLPMPTNYVTGVFGIKALSSEMNVLAGSDGTYDVYFLKDLPSPKTNNGGIKESNYLQLAVKAGNINDYTAFLKKFNFEYRFQGGKGNLTIKYSKDSSFSSGVYTLADDISVNNKWVSSDFSFNPAVTFLYPGETLYLRLYVYNTNNVFMIKYDSSSEIGPAIVGNVSPYYPSKCSETVKWTSKGWSGQPNINKKAILEADYDTAINGNFEACSIQVDNSNVIVAKDSYIKIKNAIDLKGSATLEVQSDGNLLQEDDNVVNLSKITVKRNASMKRLDYTYWGSPVTGQNVRNLSPGTLESRFYVYNESNNYFDGLFVKNKYPNGDTSITATENSSTYTFVNAKGYAIRASNYAPTTLETRTYSFTGVPNNGKIKVKINKSSDDKGINLISNPYPSNIDFDKLVLNNKGKIDHVAYFWTNFNPTPSQQQGGQYPKNGYLNNYAIYSASGGVLPTSATPSDIKEPTNIFKVGQGFLVQASKESPLGEIDIDFSNDIRTSSNDSSFYNDTSKRTSTKKVDRFWIDLKTPIGVYSHMLLAYKDGATNKFERDYDVPAYIEGSDAIYSILDHHQLLIQGRAFPLSDQDVVPLGASFDMSGIHTISITKKEGIFEDSQPIYLHDKKLGIYINLQNESYSFDAQQGTDNERFEIVYKPDSSLGTDHNSKNQLLVYQFEERIVIDSPEGLSKVIITNALGQTIYQANVKGKSTQINASLYPAGLYYITVEISNGSTQTKKILKK